MICMSIQVKVSKRRSQDIPKLRKPFTRLSNSSLELIEFLNSQPVLIFGSPFGSGQGDCQSLIRCFKARKMPEQAWLASAIRATSASFIMVALGFLFTATMNLASARAAVCWMAPLTPAADGKTWPWPLGHNP